MCFYFPKDYGNNNRYIGSLIEYNELLLAGISEEVTEKLEKINDYFLSVNKPKNYHPYNTGNFVKRNDELHEQMCFLLEEKGVDKAGELSLFQFISRVKQIEIQIEESKKK